MSSAASPRTADEVRPAVEAAIAHDQQVPLGACRF
jgi:hypothetical protein